MAKKKSRTPPPPRSVQAPKRRYEPTTSGFSRRSKLIAAAVAVALAAGIAIAVAATRGGGGSGDPTAKLAAAGCAFKTYHNLGQAHVQALTPPPKYNSFPPTSGPHYFEPAPWNFYDSPIDSQVRAVHNLEHGGIVVQWGSAVPSATVEQLRGFWDDSPNGMLMAPLPRLGDKIAMTAWTHLATCTRFDESAFAAFRDAYRGKGPERFPLSQLTPGS
jgi:Protein of unknown function (DUF3105)